MQFIIDRLHSFVFGSSPEVTGFFIQKGATQNLVMHKKNNKYWVSEWIDSTIQVVEPEGQTLQSIFKQNV
jgi:hypothetical protein